MKIFRYIVSGLLLGVFIFILLWILNTSNIINLDFNFINNNNIMSEFLLKKNEKEFWFYSFIASILSLVSVSGFGLLGLNITKKRIKGFKVLYWVTFSLLLSILILASIFLWVPGISL